MCTAAYKNIYIYIYVTCRVHNITYIGRYIICCVVASSQQPPPSPTGHDSCCYVYRYVTTYLHSPAFPGICRCTTFDDDTYLYRIGHFENCNINNIVETLPWRVHNNHLEAIRSLIWVFYTKTD